MLNSIFSRFLIRYVNKYFCQCSFVINLFYFAVYKINIKIRKSFNKNSIFCPKLTCDHFCLHTDPLIT